ncbi:amino acid permease [Oecophyllibacter saccharovorans]|uniref:APC family permease n=1 Tax=Oecophyllibacter saccharovorans TaxID=2558360 RepID=UPI00114156D8|nr:amino acid permease [Oecophyllibacter saccharovorans]QDH15804.1 amino acid permease [Oecophyllibacter saccharovorans]
MTVSFWRTKPLDGGTGRQSGLRKVFGAWHLIALGVGVTIGAGLFSLTGVAAGQHAGPAVILSFLISALACGFAGLCYAELAGMISSGGSAYSYAYASLGEIIAWFIGWDLILEYTVGAAVIASSWSGYLVSLLRSWGIVIDPRLTAPTFTPVTMPDGAVCPAWFNAPTVFIIAAITLLLMRGTTQSSRVNGIVVVIKLLVIAAVIIVCLPFIQPGNFHPFIPPNTGQFGEFGFSGVMRAAGMAFFAYLGFDIISTTTQDTRNPQRNIPIGILGSLLICAIIYAVFSFVLVGVVNYHAMATDPNPVATAMDAIHRPWMGMVIKLGITVGYLSVIYGQLFAQSRITMAMAHDGLLPPLFGRLSPRTLTPGASHLITALVASVLAACFPIAELGNMTSIGTLLAFIIVCAGVLALRWKQPHARRTFRIPGGMFAIPVLGVASCLIVMLSLDGVTWLRLALWLLLGGLVYLTYGFRHSELARLSSEPPG